MKRSKSRNQDAVSHFPILFAVVSCEETIVNSSTKFFECYTDRFAEALFIADFSKQCY